MLLECQYTLVLEMVAALRNSPDSMTMSSLKDHIDPNLMDLYPHDRLFKMAMLAKQCVEDDPILRPDMKQVVISHFTDTIVLNRVGSNSCREQSSIQRTFSRKMRNFSMSETESNTAELFVDASSF